MFEIFQVQNAQLILISGSSERLDAMNVPGCAERNVKDERYIIYLFWLICNILLSERQIKSFVLY